ncbi:MAG: 16S rRNA (cytosine(1402)-N(4))-methyltransferase RsmH [Candidatus Ryanbacteria bacterium]|nr:16S rRNA (cytosine(1402)-N(4))-methyltransferase RsmH [Candidatus Ryanbacteria bacterium]
MHIPVLTKEIIEYLNPRRGKNYIDATLDGGGHSREILKRTVPTGKVIGIEWDEAIVREIKKEKIPRLIIINDSYVNMARITQKINIKNIHGVLFDFGLSSWHFERSGRGFSFQKDEVLDMRYSHTAGDTAAEIVNMYSGDRLARIFKDFGEEPRARQFAERIVNARKRARILTTFDLLRALGLVKNHAKIHPATKIFQALRIAANNELENVERGLRAAMGIVMPGGRVAATSFHSLEDRIVKNMFRAHGKVVTKKPVVASHAEIVANPRARSARLRIWENV